MSDDLRTRIIAALLSEDDVALMADAVIRELRLEVLHVPLKPSGTDSASSTGPSWPGFCD